MKRFALIIVGLFFVVGLFVVLAITHIVRESRRIVEFECSSDCKQMPDFTVECQCHPVKK